MSRRPLSESAPVAAAAAPPPHISVVRRPLGPSTKSNVIPTAAPTNAPIQTIKTQIKIEDRLTRAEAKIADLQHEKVTVQNELGDLQTELRLAAQREAKLKHSIEKWEKSHASLKEKNSKLTELQSRLGELHKVHEESKSRRQKEIDELTEKLRREEEKRKHDLAAARHILTSEQAKAQEYQTRCAAAEKELEHLRLQGTASHDILKEKQSLIEQLQSHVESDKIVAIDAQKYARKIENELTAKIQELQAEIEGKTSQAARSAHEQQAAIQAMRSELESQIDELMEDMDLIEQQHAHNLAMVAKAVSQHNDAVQQQSTSDKAALRSKWHSNAIKRIKLETLADEREAHIRELVAVVKQVQSDRDSAKQLVSALQVDLASITEELCAERQLASLLIEQQEEQRQNGIGTSSSFGDLSGITTALDSDDASTALLRADLEDLRTRNTLLEEETADLQTRYLSRSTEAKAAEEALAAARTHVATLETSVAAKTHEVDSLVAQLAELEPLRKKLATAQEEAAAARKEAQAQVEASRSLTASLQNARVAEKAWRDERDRMAALLDQAEHYETLYNELADQAKHLLERNALAEEEKATLSALNSELLSHNNPHQKIMYMDRVRHELDDVKQENVGLRLQLERMEEENRIMQRELGSYKAVDVPLSQRPRAEVTRVLRTTDHDGLLRQVSGSMEPQQRTMQAKAARINPLPSSVSTPIQSNFPASTSKTPFSVQGPRFTATPLQPELQKTLSTEELPRRAEVVEETCEVASHPPLPVDTGLSPKKRRSYGNLSVHVTEDRQVAADEENEMEDDTLLPLPSATEIGAEIDEDGITFSHGEAAVRRNRPRHTLVNSGALRKAPSQPSSIPLPSNIPRSDSNPAATPIDAAAAAKEAGSRRPSLATSSLGIKARRVSELVRASTPPLPSIADFSNLETPNAHLLLDGALPSPSPFGLADWTATDETSHVPALHHGAFDQHVHSTPLVSMRPRNKGKSRYSGALRVHAPEDVTLTTPIAKGLLPPTRKNGHLVAVAETPTGLVYEDEHDSLRRGWMYDEEDEQVELPDFSIEGAAAQQQQKAKKQKSKAKPRGSMKVKPGPMARTFFR
ncbi:hypothetical protein PSEUBRA_001881 [Kalmanozyma brasiliensis GHG001]|uniref:Uncharacterized protein n=1 Tax=Kalmanozyma brasiliensis (strain GHG001) TaxID=1365824 RepID=V5EZV8_KALBG|nr:uncharacterized protein PSEUBRA_001881 [Kalmanozyma brasiliensis GHG001]EST08464.1 hypothetical protein PSEUBRA_001881 [Kalmanozyma brasiliensis GHG001]